MAAVLARCRVDVVVEEGNVGEVEWRQGRGWSAAQTGVVGDALGECRHPGRVALSKDVEGRRDFDGTVSLSAWIGASKAASAGGLDSDGAAG